MNDQTKNHVARIAMDELKNEWLVLDPLDQQDRRVERMAIPLPPHFGLAKAEQLAAEFNSGERSGFWTNPGQTLTGVLIPPLQYLPRAGWMQTTLAFPENYSAIQTAVANLHVELTKASKAIPQQFALFARDAGGDRSFGSVLLLTPSAAHFAALLPGVWKDAAGIDDHGWTLLYGDARDQAALGLRSVSAFN